LMLLEVGRKSTTMPFKQKLTTAPVLAHDDRTSPLELQVESGPKGLGAVLFILSEGLSRPVIFISRGLSDTEQRYETEKLQCWSLVWALDKLRHFFHNRQLTVKVPPGAIPWLMKKRDLDGVDKFAQWVLTLQQFGLFKTKVLKPSEQAAVKALADEPIGEPEETDPTDKMIAALSREGYSNRQIAILQRADPDINRIVLSMISLEDELTNEEKATLYLHRGVVYRINNSTGRKHLLLTPSILRKDLGAECHDTPVGGPQCVTKTLARFQQRYYWPNMAATVRAYVKSCAFGLQFKPRRGLPGKLQPIAPPKRLFDVYGFDHLGPFKKTKNGNEYIIGAVNLLTKFVVGRAVASTSSSESINFLREHLIYTFGSPRKLISDNGTGFTSKR